MGRQPFTDAEQSAIEFIVTDCSLDMILTALRLKMREFADYDKRVATAAHVYLINLERYPNGRPAKGEGYRAIAEQYNIRWEDLRREVERAYE